MCQNHTLLWLNFHLTQQRKKEIKTGISFIQWKIIFANIKWCSTVEPCKKKLVLITYSDTLRICFCPKKNKKRAKKNNPNFNQSLWYIHTSTNTMLTLTLLMSEVGWNNNKKYSNNQMMVVVVIVFLNIIIIWQKKRNENKRIN